MDLLTWMDRRILLVPESSADGIRVSRVVLAAGDRLAVVPREELHTMWRRGDPKKGAAPFVPKRHGAGRNAWQGLDSLVAIGTDVDNDKDVQTSPLLKQVLELQADDALGVDFPLGVEIVGVRYGTQSAVVDDLIADSVPLPVRSLVANDVVRDAVLEVAAQATAVERAVNLCYADLRRAAGGDPVPWDKGQRPGSVFVHSIDQAIRLLLSKFAVLPVDGDTEPLMLSWETSVRELALQAVTPLILASNPSAFLGRHEKDSGKQVYRESTAVANFRSQLRRILPRDAARRDEGKTA